MAKKTNVASVEVGRDTNNEGRSLAITIEAQKKVIDFLKKINNDNNKRMSSSWNGAYYYTRGLNDDIRRAIEGIYFARWNKKITLKDYYGDTFIYSYVADGGGGIVNIAPLRTVAEKHKIEVIMPIDLPNTYIEQLAVMYGRIIEIIHDEFVVDRKPSKVIIQS